MWHTTSIDPIAKRSHVTVWKWVQILGKDAVICRCRVTAFLVDETYVRAGEYDA